MSDIRLVSLFDGISGFPLAFGRAGVRTAATCEIDKAAAGVAVHHYPDAAHFADITELTADDLFGLDLDPARTIFSAGWPCTDLSLAGLRLGLGGARSGLVGEVFRLLLGFRPRRFVLENVPGLLSSVCPCPGGGICAGSPGKRGYYDAETKQYECTTAHPVRGGACGRPVRNGRFTGAGRCMALHGGGMGTVLRRLGECGYGVAYRVLDAQHFGVPQRRRRVVIVGHLGDSAGPVEVLLEPEGCGGDPATGPAARAGTAGRPGTGTPIAGGSAVAPTLQGGGRRGYRIDAEMAAGGGLVPAVIPLQNSVSTAGGNVLAGPTGPGHGVEGGPMFTLDTTAPHAVAVVSALTRTSITGTDDNTAQGGQLVPVDPEVWQQQGSKLQPMGTMRRGNGNVTGGVPFLAATITAREGKGPDSDATTTLITHALTAEGADASEDGTGRGTPIVPVDLAQVTSGENRSNPRDGDPAGMLAATSRSAIAFGEVHDVSAGEEVSPSVRTGTGGGQIGVSTMSAVRRLTPVECERLQGFPDGWTAKRAEVRREGNRWVSGERAEVEQSDAARYRQLGNSIAEPVFEWVAHRMIAADGDGAP